MNVKKKKEKEKKMNKEKMKERKRERENLIMVSRHTWANESSLPCLCLTILSPLFTFLDSPLGCLLHVGLYLFSVFVSHRK